MEKQIFADLQGLTMEGEMAIKMLPTVTLVAVGGFPITKGIHGYNWCGYKNISLGTIRDEIIKGLGVSGMLTYMNKSRMSNQQMGAMLLDINHTWANHWMTLTFLFNSSEKVELSFLRHNKFYESWLIEQSWMVHRKDKAFAMSGSVKDFSKYVANRNDNSFDIKTRQVMQYIYDTFGSLWE